MSQFAAERSSAVSERADEAFAALGYAAVGKAPRQAPVFASRWSTWADVRGSGFEQSDSRVLKGTQINATGGITYKLRSDLVVGAFAGYENFNYDFASLTGKLKGNGGTIGTYAGWQITPTLRWKGMIGWTGLGYDASAATASGNFDGARWLVSTGLTGGYRVARIHRRAQSADIFAIWERQTGYTDNLGVAHDTRNFSTGRVSLGGRALAPDAGMVRRHAVSWILRRLAFCLGHGTTRRRPFHRNLPAMAGRRASPAVSTCECSRSDRFRSAANTVASARTTRCGPAKRGWRCRSD